MKEQESHVAGVQIKIGAVAGISGTAVVTSYLAGPLAGVVVLFGGVCTGIGASRWYHSDIIKRISRKKEGWDIDKQHWLGEVWRIRKRIEEIRDRFGHMDLFSLPNMRRWQSEADRVVDALTLLLKNFEVEYGGENPWENSIESLNRKKLGFISAVVSMQKKQVDVETMIKYIVQNLNSNDTVKDSEEYFVEDKYFPPTNDPDYNSHKKRATGFKQADDNLDGEPFVIVTEEEAGQSLNIPQEIPENYICSYVGNLFSTVDNSRYSNTIRTYMDDIRKWVDHLKQLSRVLECFKDAFSDMINAE